MKTEIENNIILSVAEFAFLRGATDASDESRPFKACVWTDKKNKRYIATNGQVAAIVKTDKPMPSAPYFKFTKNGLTYEGTEKITSPDFSVLNFHWESKAWRTSLKYLAENINRLAGKRADEIVFDIDNIDIFFELYPRRKNPEKPVFVRFSDGLIPCVKISDQDETHELIIAPAKSVVS